MNENLYEIVELKNGLKMLSVKPINDTGIAEAYCTLRNNPIGNSKGPCGPFSCNIYKKYGLYEGIRDFEMCCDALNIQPSKVITNRLTAFTNKVRVVNTESLIGYDIYDEVNAPRADGLVTNSSDVTLFNYAADCSIILLCDTVNKVCGSLHASWKGSLIGIIENEIKCMKEEFKSHLENIIAVVMPSIGLEAFEVGEDVAKQFSEAGYEEYVDYTSYKKPHIDLAKVNRQILLNCGLKKENVNIIDLCTYSQKLMFHSYRRGPIDENGNHLNGVNGFFIRLK